MAESIVQVTEGAGKKLHTFNRTIGANSVEDEVVLNGEPYLATYTITTPAVSVATAAAHALQIMAGASLKVRVRRIQMFQIAAATAAVIADFNVLRLTTAGTGGGVVTASPLDPTDAASGATCMTLPTVKGTEGVALDAYNPYLIQTVGASTTMVSPAADRMYDLLRTKPIIIAAGAANGICVKVVAGYAAATVRFVVWIDESNF
jgi:hypothetical protein